MLWGIVIAIVLAICAAIIANNKNRCSWGWFFITLFFPIFILILLCLKPLPNSGIGQNNSATDLTNPLPQSETAGTVCIESEPEERVCPYCAEKIKSNAKLCRYCGKKLPVDVNLYRTRLNNLNTLLSEAEAHKEKYTVKYKSGLMNATGYYVNELYFKTKDEAEKEQNKIISADEKYILELKQKIGECKEQIAKAEHELANI